MTHFLFVAKPEPILIHCQLHSQEWTSITFESRYKYFLWRTPIWDLSDFISHVYFEIRVLSVSHSMGLATPGNVEHQLSVRTHWGRGGWQLETYHWGAHHLTIQTLHWTVLHNVQPMPPSCLRQRAQAHQHHSYTILTNDVQVCTVHLFDDTGNIITKLLGDTLSPPQILPARQHVFPHAWHHCRQSVPPCPQQSPLSFLQGNVDVESWTLFLYSVVHPSVYSTTRCHVSTAGSWTDCKPRWQHPA